QNPLLLAWQSPPNLPSEQASSITDLPCHPDQRPPGQVAYVGYLTIRPANLQPLHRRVRRQPKVNPRRIAGDIAADGAHIAVVCAGTGVERKLRANRADILAGRPEQVDLESLAAAQTVLEHLGW